MHTSHHHVPFPLLARVEPWPLIHKLVGRWAEDRSCEIDFCARLESALPTLSTAPSPVSTEQQQWMMIDWLVRDFTRGWLTLREETRDHARALDNLPALSPETMAQAYDVLSAAETQALRIYQAEIGEAQKNRRWKACMDTTNFILGTDWKNVGATSAKAALADCLPRKLAFAWHVSHWAASSFCFNAARDRFEVGDFDGIRSQKESLDSLAYRVICLEISNPMDHAKRSLIHCIGGWGRRCRSRGPGSPTSFQTVHADFPHTAYGW